MDPPPSSEQLVDLEAFLRDTQDLGPSLPAWMRPRLARGRRIAELSLRASRADVTDDEHRRAAQAVRELMAAYRDHEDLISIGAYRRGSNRMVDCAIDMQNDLRGYLRQAIDQPGTRDEARNGLLQLHQQSLRRLRSEGVEAT